MTKILAFLTTTRSLVDRCLDYFKIFCNVSFSRDGVARGPHWTARRARGQAASTTYADASEEDTVQLSWRQKGKPDRGGTVLFYRASSRLHSTVPLRRTVTKWLFFFFVIIDFFFILRTLPCSELFTLASSHPQEHIKTACVSFWPRSTRPGFARILGRSVFFFFSFISLHLLLLTSTRASNNRIFKRSKNKFFINLKLVI